MPGTTRSGRRPQPGAIRDLQGSKTRPHHRREPHYRVAAPEPPAVVSDDPIALERWRVLAARLVSSRVLSEADGEMLALLCTAWADLERSRQALRAAGRSPLVIEERMTATGESIQTVKAHPLIKTIHDQAAQVARFLGEFGLTPMTRAKVAADQAAEGVDPFAEFMSGVQ